MAVFFFAVAMESTMSGTEFKDKEPLSAEAAG